MGTNIDSQISDGDALDHGLLKAKHCIGKINSRIHPYVVADIQLGNRPSGERVVCFAIIHKQGKSRTRTDRLTGESEQVRGIYIATPIVDILPNEAEIDLIIESIRQDLDICGATKIII